MDTPETDRDHALDEEWTRQYLHGRWPGAVVRTNPDGSITASWRFTGLPPAPAEHFQYYGLTIAPSTFRDAVSTGDIIDTGVEHARADFLRHLHYQMTHGWDAYVARMEEEGDI